MPTRRTALIMAGCLVVSATVYVANDTSDRPPEQIVMAASATPPLPFEIRPDLPSIRIPNPLDALTTTTSTTVPPTTTTTAPPPTTTTAPPPPPPAPAPVQGGPTDEQLAALRQCESGGNYQMNSGNGYYGAYQFLPSTWRSMGTGYDMPHTAPPEVQDDAARRLIIRSGWGQFPACSRKIGAR